MAEWDALLDYFAALERLGFEVTVNDFSGLLVADQEASARLDTYFIHRNPFCMAIKSDRRLWDECLRKKSRLCAAAAAAAGCFRGSCFAGREEYVQPVRSDALLLATIALGGFSSDRESGLERARRAPGSPGEAGADGESEAAGALERAYGEAIRREPPDEKDAAAFLGLAASELRRQYLRLEGEAGRLTVPEAARLGRERRIALHAAEYLRRRLDRQVEAREVAASCHVSVSTLSHLFKRVMGASLRAYALTLRIERAKEALRAGASVTEAALSSGFDDPNYFSRAFAKAEGRPPTEYRRSPPPAGPQALSPRTRPSP